LMNPSNKFGYRDVSAMWRSDSRGQQALSDGTKLQPT